MYELAAVHMQTVVAVYNIQTEGTSHKVTDAV